MLPQKHSHPIMDFSKEDGQACSTNFPSKSTFCAKWAWNWIPRPQINLGRCWHPKSPIYINFSTFLRKWVNKEMCEGSTLTGWRWSCWYLSWILFIYLFIICICNVVRFVTCLKLVQAHEASGFSISAVLAPGRWRLLWYVGSLSKKILWQVNVNFLWYIMIYILYNICRREERIRNLSLFLHKFCVIFFSKET